MKSKFCVYCSDCSDCKLVRSVAAVNSGMELAENIGLATKGIT
jgi:hypothetical protein